MAKFPNHPSGHKALVAYLLRNGARVRVCLEASGNYSLDLALTLQAHRHLRVRCDRVVRGVMLRISGC